jgi:hypothetical protein
VDWEFCCGVAERAGSGSSGVVSSNGVCDSSMVSSKPSSGFSLYMSKSSFWDSARAGAARVSSNTMVKIEI